MSVKEPILKPTRHAHPESQLAWVLHRITGVGIFLFLLLHIFHIWLAGFGPVVFNRMIDIFNHPLARLMHIFLFFSVLFHAINGLRVIVLDFWPAAERYQRLSVYAAGFLFFTLFIPSTLLILMDAFLPSL